MAKTNSEYVNNIKNKIITEKMLGEATYSINKRAKNCRDAGERAKKEEYYDMKDELLSIVKPTCIHKEYQTRRIKRKQYYCYGRYYRIVEEAKRVEKYYLYYEVGDFSFHRPLSILYLNEYKELDVIDIGALKTTGKAIDGLMSVQCARKIIALIKSGEYIYVTDS